MCDFTGCADDGSNERLFKESQEVFVYCDQHDPLDDDRVKHRWAEVHDA